MANRKSFKATWNGDGDPQAQMIHMFGLRFIKGEETRVPANLYVEGIDAYDTIYNNPSFSVEDEEPDPVDAGEENEEEALKKQLDELGVKYRANASVDTLRNALDRATAPKADA